MIRRMMERLNRGLKGKPNGPLFDAIQILEGAVKASKEKGLYDSSPTLKSVSVLLDHTKKAREALKFGVDLVNKLEDQGEWTPEKSKQVADSITAFKLACVGARLHQKTDEELLN